MIGDAGADVFRYLAASDSTTGKNHDVINDFEHGTDQIDLSRIDPDTKSHAFRFVGDKAIAHVGDIHVEQDAAHGDTMIEINMKGDDTPEMRIELKGLVDLDEGDFIL